MRLKDAPKALEKEIIQHNTNSLVQGFFYTSKAVSIGRNRQIFEKGLKIIKDEIFRRYLLKDQQIYEVMKAYPDIKAFVLAMAKKKAYQDVVKQNAELQAQVMEDLRKKDALKQLD